MIYENDLILYRLAPEKRAQTTSRFSEQSFTRKIELRIFLVNIFDEKRKNRKSIFLVNVNIFDEKRKIRNSIFLVNDCSENHFRKSIFLVNILSQSSIFVNQFCS